MAIDMTEVLRVKDEFGGDIVRVKRELKRLQSVKCRLKKQKSRADYQSLMTETVQKEQVLKEVRQLLEPKKTAVPEFTQADVDELDFEDTMKAIKSIQSKKCLSQNDESEYEKACKVEQMLLEHKKQVKPADETTVKKSEVRAILENLKSLTAEEAGRAAIEQLEKLLG
jgi:hypothetical protein